MIKKRKLKKSVSTLIKIFLLLIGIFLANYLLGDKITSKLASKVVNVSKIEIEEEQIDFTDLPDNEVFNTLKEMTKKDRRIKYILKNYKEYPFDLLTMLSRNIDMTDFVLSFPLKKSQTFIDGEVEIKKGSIPLFLQWDKRWGYSDYGENYLAISGCGPTALAMVIAGLNNDKSINPYVIAKDAMDNGYYINGVGTSWLFMTEAGNKYHVKGQALSLSKENVYKHLKAGHPIITSMKPGDFTTFGHFIVLTGIEKDKIKVNDSNSVERSNKLWTYDTLKPQIKAAWVFQKI